MSDYYQRCEVCGRGSSCPLDCPDRIDPRRASATLRSLGMLGVALAGPAATEQAAEIAYRLIARLGSYDRRATEERFAVRDAIRKGWPLP